MVEPAVVVNFAFPSELRLSDLPYFLWRWSEQAPGHVGALLHEVRHRPGIPRRRARDRLLVTSGFALRTAPSSRRTQIRQPGAQAVLAVLRKTAGPSNDPQPLLHPPATAQPAGRRHPLGADAVGRLGHTGSSQRRSVRSSVPLLLAIVAIVGAVVMPGSWRRRRPGDPSSQLN